MEKPILFIYFLPRQSMACSTKYYGSIGEHFEFVCNMLHVRAWISAIPATLSGISGSEESDSWCDTLAHQTLNLSLWFFIKNCGMARKNKCTQFWLWYNKDFSCLGIHLFVYSFIYFWLFILIDSGHFPPLGGSGCNVHKYGAHQQQKVSSSKQIFLPSPPPCPAVTSYKKWSHSHLNPAFIMEFFFFIWPTMSTTCGFLFKTPPCAWKALSSCRPSGPPEAARWQFQSPSSWGFSARGYLILISMPLITK